MNDVSLSWWMLPTDWRLFYCDVVAGPPYSCLLSTHSFGNRCVCQWINKLKSPHSLCLQLGWGSVNPCLSSFSTRPLPDATKQQVGRHSTELGLLSVCLALAWLAAYLFTMCAAVLGCLMTRCEGHALAFAGFWTLNLADSSMEPIMGRRRKKVPSSSYCVLQYSCDIKESGCMLLASYYYMYNEFKIASQSIMRWMVKTSFCVLKHVVLTMHPICSITLI